MAYQLIPVCPDFKSHHHKTINILSSRKYFILQTLCKNDTCDMCCHIWLVIDFYICFLSQKVTIANAAAQKLNQIRLDLVIGLHEYNVSHDHLFFIRLFLRSPFIIIIVNIHLLIYFFFFFLNFLDIE